MTRGQMKSHFVVHTNGQDEWIKVDKRIYDKAIDMFCAAHDAELKAKDERIATLEAMAQKMKCCMNCDGQGDREDNYYCFLADCDNLSLWRLKDNK